MAANLIATTLKIAMQPLAFQGIMVYTCFPQIRDMLLRKFGDDYVLLFARPAENSGDGKIDWYSPVQGEARRLKDLPEAESGPIYERLGQMAAEIAKFGDELINSGDPLKVTRGNILKLALRYPDDDALYVVGGQPVFTCWGFAPGTPGAEGKYLTRLAPKPAPRPAPAAPPVSSGARSGRGWAWLWWLFPMLGALALFFLLFSAFGPLEAVGGVTIFRWPAFWEEPHGGADLVALEGEVADLGAKLREHIGMCVQEPAPEAPKAEEELKIPEDARNAEFMEGEWRCETGLANAATREPVQLSIAFAKNGSGTATTNEKGGQCHGDARVSLQDGVLHIEIGEQTCPHGNAYNAVSIDCRTVAGQSSALCQGTHGSGSKWDATFYKVK